MHLHFKVIINVFTPVWSKTELLLCLLLYIPNLIVGLSRK